MSGVTPEVITAGALCALTLVQAARLALALRQRVESHWATDAYRAATWAPSGAAAPAYRDDCDEADAGMQALGLNPAQRYRRLRACYGVARARKQARLWAEPSGNPAARVQRHPQAHQGLTDAER